MAGYRLVFALAVLASIGLCAANAPLGFIRAQDSRFVDKDCNEFNFVGTNACVRLPAARCPTAMRRSGGRSPTILRVHCHHPCGPSDAVGGLSCAPAVWRAACLTAVSRAQLLADSALWHHLRRRQSAQRPLLMLQSGSELLACAVRRWRMPSMAAGTYPYADGSGWPTTSSWLIRPENPAAGPMSPALWAIRQMQVGSGSHVPCMISTPLLA